MPNVIQDGTTKQHWMPKMQRELRRRMVALGISEVYSGPDRIVHNPYQSKPAGSDGAASVTYSVSDFNVTDDTLTVSRRADVAEHIDNIEQLQSRYDLAMKRAEIHSYTVKNKIDQYVLSLPVSASGIGVIDDGDFGGTPGNPKTTSSSNIDEVANKIVNYLGLNDAALERGMFWVVSPNEVEDITGFMQSNGFASADAAIKNGFAGEAFGGLRIYVSNNLTHTVTLGLATNPTADDTITITVGARAITWTFKAVPAAAGEIDIGADADATRVLLTAAINNTNGYDAGEGSATAYFEVSARDREKLSESQVTAVNDASANTMAITARGTISVSEDLTDGTDAWTAVKRNTIAGVMGSLFVALPEDGMTFEKKAVSGKHGRELVTAQVYNATIWENRKEEIFLVVVN